MINSTKCPKCGKDLSYIVGNCEPFYDKVFYGGRVSFTQREKCDCKNEYTKYIEQTEEGLKVIDLDYVVKSEEELKQEQIDSMKGVINRTLNIAYKSPQDRLMQLTNNELKALLKRAKVSFKDDETKVELVDKVMSVNPLAVGIFDE